MFFLYLSEITRAALHCSHVSPATEHVPQSTCPLLVAVVVVLHRVGVSGRVAGAVVVEVAVVRGDLVMDVVVRTVVVISPDYLLLVLRRTE